MSFIEYVIPVFATLAGWLVLGREVTPATVGGFAFIVAGFVAAKWRRCVGYRSAWVLITREVLQNAFGACSVAHRCDIR